MIKSLIQSCQACERTIIFITLHKAPMQIIPLESRVIVAVDLLTPKTIIQDEFAITLLVMEKKKSKYLVARPLQEKSTRKVLNLVRSIFLEYGPPLEALLDND